MNWWIGKNSSAVKLSWFDSAEFAWVCLGLPGFVVQLAGRMQSGVAAWRGFSKRARCSDNGPQQAEMQWCGDATTSRRQGSIMGGPPEQSGGLHLPQPAVTRLSPPACPSLQPLLVSRVLPVSRVWRVSHAGDLFLGRCTASETAEWFTGWCAEYPAPRLLPRLLPSWLLSPFNLFIAAAVAALLK